jgi:hypothetical protein
MADDAVLQIFDDLIARLDAKPSPSQLAIARTLAGELARDTPDCALVCKLEGMLPKPKAPPSLGEEVERLQAELAAERKCREADRREAAAEGKPLLELSRLSEGDLAELERIVGLAQAPEGKKPLADAPVPFEQASGLRAVAQGGEKGLSGVVTAGGDPGRPEAPGEGANRPEKVVPLRKPTAEQEHEMRMARARANHDRALLEGEPVADRARTYPVVDGGTPDVDASRAHLGFRRFDNFQ